MIQGTYLVAIVIAVSFIEFSTQQRTEEGKDSKRFDASDAKVRAETLAAVRRGDIRGFRSGMNKGGLAAYSNIYNHLPYKKLKAIENAMNNKMHAIEGLISSKLVVPAQSLKEQPDQRYLFNVTILPETDIISQLSLNLTALKSWDYYDKPLHTICNLPDVEPRIVKYLLDNSSDVNERSKLHVTPLDLAAFNGNLALAKFLIGNGADPKITGRIDVEKYKGGNYHRFIKVLSPKDFIIRPGSKVHYNSLVSAITGGHKDMVKYLISLGTDVNVDHQSWAALFNPVMDGDSEMVEILLKHGCDVNGRDTMGTSALHMAADKSDVEMAELLLKYGANVTAMDDFGWTPLHVAALSSHNIAMVELLLEAGASTEATTDRGFTPFNLVEAGTDPWFLDCLGSVVASNFTKKPSCQRKLNMCKHDDNIYIITLLHSMNVKVNHQDDALGWSTLHWAAAIGDANVTRLLVEKYRASVQARSKAGMSPADTAEYFGRNELSDYLRKAKN